MPQGQGLKGDTSSNPLLDLVNAINPFAYPIQQGLQIAQQGLGPFAHDWWQELMGNSPQGYMGVVAPKPAQSSLDQMNSLMYGGKTMADWYKQYGYDPKYFPSSLIESHTNDPSLEVHWVPTVHKSVADNLYTSVSTPTPVGQYVTYKNGLIDQMHGNNHDQAAQQLEKLYQQKHGHPSNSAGDYNLLITNLLSKIINPDVSPLQIPIPSDAKQLPLPLYPKKSYIAQPSEARDLNTLINSKDSVYHATSLQGFHGILDSGMLRPGYGQDVLPGYGHGVSTSRIPRVASKGAKAISFVIDKDALRNYQATPIAEKGFKKTLNNKYTSQPDAPMNKQFEFEDRTKGEPIPLRYVKGIVVDLKALNMGIESDIWQDAITKKWKLDYNDPKTGQSNTLTSFPTQKAAQDFADQISKQHVQDIKERATQAGLPIKFLENGKQVNQYRARMSQIPKGEPLYGLGAGLGAYQLYKQLTGQGQQGDQQ